MDSSIIGSEFTRYVVQPEDTSTEVFPWGSITWMDSAAITGSETLTVGVVCIEPGQSNPEHLHPNCDETLYLVEGELDHSIEDSHYPLVAGSLIHVPIGLRHQARNSGAVTARMVVSYNTGRREIVHTGR